jgi:hypothetical protein
MVVFPLSLTMLVHTRVRGLDWRWWGGLTLSGFHFPVHLKGNKWKGHVSFVHLQLVISITLA